MSHRDKTREYLAFCPAPGCNKEVRQYLPWRTKSGRMTFTCECGCSWFMSYEYAVRINQTEDGLNNEDREEMK